MKTQYVIPSKYIPFRLPIWPTAFQVFLMVHYNLPGWACGIWATVLFIIWVGILYGKSEQIENEKLINKPEKNGGNNSL